MDGQFNRHEANRTLLAVPVVMIAIVTAISLAAYFMESSIHAASTPMVREIVNGTFTVSAGSYEYYSFDVPSGASKTTVQGTFTVSGGGENEINLYVMDSANFANWQNGRNASWYYDSGELSTGTVTATLPSDGNYDLIFDNTFSAGSKIVNAEVGFYYIPG